MKQRTCIKRKPSETQPNAWPLAREAELCRVQIWFLYDQTKLSRHGAWSKRGKQNQRGALGTNRLHDELRGVGLGEVGQDLLNISCLFGFPWVSLGCLGFLGSDFGFPVASFAFSLAPLGVPSGCKAQCSHRLENWIFANM